MPLCFYRFESFEPEAHPAAYILPELIFKLFAVLSLQNNLAAKLSAVYIPLVLFCSTLAVAIVLYSGVTMEQYFQFTGLSEEKMMEEFKPEAEKRIRTRLTLEAIVAAENIEVSEERLDEELQKMADSYKMEVDKLKEYMGENEKKQMKEDIAIQEAVTLIANAAVEG